MRMMLKCNIPHEPFNTLVREGRAGQIIGGIMEEMKPEAAYFIEEDGKRCGVFIINLGSPSEVPKFAEPFFLNFNADCHFQVVMSPDDLKNAGLEELGTKWG
jgi:hypothetical protein